jgi:hypothetical protein
MKWQKLMLGTLRVLVCRGKVFGPLAVEVDVPNPLHARILEQHVPSEHFLRKLV